MKSQGLLIVILTITTPCFANILTVNPNGSAQYANLNEALQQALPNDTVKLAPGVYRGSPNKNLSYSNGSITIESEQGPQTCVIDCEENGHFLDFSGPVGGLLTLNGLTIANAATETSVIDVSRGSLVMNNCLVHNCVFSGITYNGGVVYASAGDTITLTRSKFFNNQSEEIDGIFNAFGSVLSAWETKVNIDHCVFANNSSDIFGGVVFTYSLEQIDKTLTMTNSTFHNNSSSNPEFPGSAFVTYLDQPATIRNCIITNNNNFAISILKMTERANMAVNSCLFSNNGGICIDLINGTSYSTVSSLSGVFETSNNITGNPNFAEDTDFHLLDGSAAIDKGLTTQHTIDLDGLPRQTDGDQNGTVTQDIGPYEYDPEHPLIVTSQSSLVFTKDVNAPNPQDQTFSFRNTTPSPLNWQLISESPWLKVSQNFGELINDKTSVTVSVDSDGMPRGIHSGLLTLSDPNAPTSPIQILVSLRILGKLIVPNQFTTIIHAAQNAMSGETIEVHGGDYEGGIVLDKPLTLIGYQDPNISTTHNNGIQILADNCHIQGFTLNGTGPGIYISGSNNTLKNIIITQGDTGVYLSNGSNNTLDQLSIANCLIGGLNIQDSPGSTVTNVTIMNCLKGFTLTGQKVSDYQQNIDQTNTVDGNPIFYLVGESDRVIAPNLATPACVYLVECADIVLFRLGLSGNGRAICIVNSSNNTVRSVSISDCDAGIWLFEAPNNTLMSNTINDCDYGIRLEHSAQTTMTKNILTDNVSSFSLIAEETHYQQTIDTTNLINDLPIYYLVGQENVTLDETNPAACIYALQCRNLVITNQTITNNTHGIALIDCSNTTVENVICRDNQESNLYIANCNNVTVNQGLFTHSSYGIDMINSTNVEISNVECGHNGTGIQTISVDFTLINALIHNNTQGGGIGYYASAERQGIIQGCTIINNSLMGGTVPDEGGAITGAAELLNILDSILWNNTPGTLPYPQFYNYTASYCCVQDPLDGPGNITKDPLLTPDGHLTINSPCINAATPGRRRVTGVDMDGDPRRVGTNVDIGADEYQDADSDGLPDWFEKQQDPNGLAMDPDGDLNEDGTTNIEEYTGGITSTPSNGR